MKRKGGVEWTDAVSRAKKALGFSPNEFVEDWDSVIAMAKAILAEDRGDVHNEKDTRPRSANDKTIFAHYLSDKPIPERLLVKKTVTLDSALATAGLRRRCK